MNSNSFRSSIRRAAGAVVTLAAVVGATLVAAPAASAATAAYGSGSDFCKSVGAGAYPLGASFDNVFACGPSLYYGDIFDPYPNAFQCVELVNRFESVVYGKGVVYADGAAFVQTLHAQFGVPVEGPKPGQLPSAGDVISLSRNGALPGHVAVVTGVDAPMGNGVIHIMEQNASAKGANTITVKNWNLTYGTSGFNSFLWSVQARHASGAIVMRHVGAGGYRIGPDGTVNAFGGAPALAATATWPGHDYVRGAVLRSDDKGGYVVDLYGGLHPFGNAPAEGGTAYWSGWDIARGITLRSNNTSGYVLDGYGGLHPFGGAPAVSVSAYWSGWDIATGIAQYDDGGGWVLDGYGGLHPFGDAPAVTATAYWSGWEIAEAVVVTHGGAGPGGLVLDGYGGMHPFGSATTVSTPAYHAGIDSATAVTIASNGSTGYVLETTGAVSTITGSTSACHTCS